MMLLVLVWSDAVAGVGFGNATVAVVVMSGGAIS